MAEAADPAAVSGFAALRQLARQAARRAEEQCDLCGDAIGREHRHILDLPKRDLLCACRACTLLFDQQGAGAGGRRLVPTRTLRLTAFDMPDLLWERLRLPVGMAFFSRNSDAGRVTAFYPSPAGPTESLLHLESWEELELRNPLLLQLEPDVEALLINRVREAREYFLVPIDECYRLVGLIRLHWKGLSGGQDVWQEIERLFDELRRRARPSGDADA